MLPLLLILLRFFADTPCRLDDDYVSLTRCFDAAFIADTYFSWRRFSPPFASRLLRFAMTL